MQGEEIFTPASEITAARQNVVQKTQAPARRVAPKDEDKAKRAGQVHFKAAHGLVVAFLTFILYVTANVRHSMFNRTDRLQDTSHRRYILVHQWIPPYATSPRSQVRVLDPSD